ncbi:electron transfer flavoprotein subunit alpha/FixB family protein [Adhaeribacter rhizoryzae]|uniref:Electron transfer flavoprotein subunit alpha/FixB family protein n=1 Tax=Adhaeribacter rhizoryzae TaxID=2607907 RepID=A0A5M6DBN9_9BACT|nr:electron transfer flavoprotein subunit alpha/FixB family protein [Adhaeribacter rhizoryzae]KAA5544793.1 electron transfer flavoprotein subunit alpha/FixB family protein [Adhaeribacter rhizoryzae]
MAVLVLIECAEGQIKKSALEVASYGFQVAQTLGTTAAAVAIGDINPEALTALGKQGITKVYYNNQPEVKNFVPAAYVNVIAQAAETSQAKVIILANSTIGSAVGARLAVRLNASFATNVVSLPEISGESFKVQRGVFSGKAFADVNLTGDRKIIAVKKNTFDIVEQEGTAETEQLSLTFSSADLAGAPQETIKTTGKILLTEAEVVVSGGRGLRGPENWHLIEDLADALGAATACSKPVADVGWRPHHEHVGQTGTTISPNLYIAAGISGAIQHLAGVNSSKVIVVINKDPEAPFFKAADYGIVGDVAEVLPKLTEAARALNQ